MLLVAVVAFLLNFAWENLQSPLYRGGLSGIWYLIIYTRATLFDALYTVALYIGFAVFKRDGRWVDRVGWPDAAGIFFAGFIVASWIERCALDVNRWGYSESMLLIPYLGVGVMPVLQLMLLPYATFLTARLIARKFL